MAAQFSARNGLIRLLGRLVDHSLAFLARLIDLVEGRLHACRRHDVLQFDRDDVQAVVVTLHGSLDLLAGVVRYLHAPDFPPFGIA